MRNGKMYYFGIKRILDILLSLTGIICFSWLYLLIGIIIKFSDGGPIIHKRECIGKNVRPFNMYKFRTMVVDADNLERWLTVEQMEEYKKFCKLDNDPRITKVGRFLRKSSLDEIPQLVNVLIGNMSLIGPRPVVQREADAYGDDINLLLSVKPGITGYWQVYGRGEDSYIGIECKQQQKYYVLNCGFALDIKILLRTVVVVLSGRGAK